MLRYSVITLGRACCNELSATTPFSMNFDAIARLEKHRHFTQKRWCGAHACDVSATIRKIRNRTTLTYSTSTKSWLSTSDGGPRWAAKPLLCTRWDNPLLYAWTALCQRLPPRRPRVGRCSRERRLIRSAGAPNYGALTGFVAR
jgi:hypothetical protein